MTDAAGAGQDVVVSEESITALTTTMDEVLIQLDNTRRGVANSAGDAIAGWRGEAASQFGSGAEEARNTLNRLINSVGNLKELVQMSRDSFTAEEQEQASQLRSVNAGYQDLRLNSGIADL
ncbi:WXG100 family type VII secretion target [Streptomyces sp. NPDC049879]|uniref:WXG100 family type VII secretion target n=2 Tax=unclassified Streptomyces TaxID=2593676 RepID=UPI0037A7A0D3